MAKPDPAFGYINGELRFGYWAQEVVGDRAAAQEGRQARANWNLLKEQPVPRPHWRSRADQYGPR